MLNDQKLLDSLAQEAYEELETANSVLVLAESCTSGLIAATMARIPGMSSRLAGSFVVYQIASKIAWLNVDSELIRQCDVVSREVAESMATGALEKTPHANIALAITGHLGPDAPVDLDGIAWLAIAIPGGKVHNTRLMLQAASESVSEEAMTPTQIRHARQRDAVRQAMVALLAFLKHATGG